MIRGFMDEAIAVLSSIRSVADGETAELETSVRNAEALADAGEACGLPDFESSARNLAAALAGAMQEPQSSLAHIHDLINEVENALASAITMTEGPFTEVAAPAADSAPDTPAEDEFEIDDELREVFAEEADELLKQIESNLQLVAANPADRDALWEIRRNAHTFKGAAGVVGLKTHSTIAHRIEDFLDHLSEKNLGANDRIIALLNSATECLKRLTYEAASPSAQALVAQTFAAFEDAQALIDSPPPAEPAPVQPVQPASSPEPAPVADAKPAYAQTRSGLRVTAAILDDLVNNVHELMEIRTLLEQRLGKFQRYVAEIKDAATRMHHAGVKVESEIDIQTSSGRVKPAFPQSFQTLTPSAPNFDSLELDRYTELHEWSREASQAAGETLFYVGELEVVKNEIDSLAVRQRLLIDEVQSKVTRVRTVEFGSVAARLQRAAKAACEEFPEKDVEVIVDNGSEMIDSQLAEKLIEPLSHLVRNSVVHGIESQDQRTDISKAAAGTIKVGLSNEETHVVVTLSDDGAGIDFESLRSKAVASGLVAQESVSALNEKDLLFMEGLTTAPALSMNAGRGVGMSIVEKSVQAISGTVSVRSSRGAGTSFSLRIPLSMVVLQSVVVRVGEHIMAVPQRHIRRIIEVSRSVAEAGSITLDDTTHSLRFLAEHFAITTAEANDFVPVLIVNCADRPAALAVDEIVRTEEIIVKSFAKPLDAMTQYLGAAFLNSGHLAPIIDTPAIMSEHASARAAAPPPSAIEFPTAAAITVMIVDDSPSVRVMTSRTISQAGYKPIAAKDGVDALNILGSLQQLPDMILSDIEMPQMDGYELLANLKSDERYRSIPVAMISSRSGDKHREKGLELGAVCYLTKPYNDAELINAMNESITSSAAG